RASRTPQGQPRTGSIDIRGPGAFGARRRGGARTSIAVRLSTGAAGSKAGAMILRGAVLSDDRVSLELQQRGRAAPEFARTPLEHLQTERTAPELPPTAASGPGGPEPA